MFLILELMKNGLIGGLLIYVMLILIELIDLIRVIIIIIMNKNSFSMKIFYWLINILFVPLNSKRIITILLKSSSKSLCKLIENDKDILSKIGFEKEINSKDFWKHFILSLIQILILFVFLCLIDIGIVNEQINKLKINSIHHQFNPEELDENVLEERICLLSKKESLVNVPLACVDIIKKYPRKENLALNHLTFHVQQGQCFGLLGFNGAGWFHSFSFQLTNRL